jgi:hypothetical protein
MILSLSIPSTQLMGKPMFSFLIGETKTEETNDIFSHRLSSLTERSLYTGVTGPFPLCNNERKFDN